MRGRTVGAALGTIAVGGTVYQLRKTSRARKRSRAGDRAHVVTVNRPPEEVGANLPGELTGPGSGVKVELRAAPGGRGTEIHAWATDPGLDEAQLRRALRISRSLLEVGDVLKPGGPTTTPTVLNRALQSVTRHGREKGML